MKATEFTLQILWYYIMIGYREEVWNGPLIHSYKSRLLFACQTSKQKSTHAHLFQLSNQRGSQKRTTFNFLFIFYCIFFFSICNVFQMFYKMYLYTCVVMSIDLIFIFFKQMVIKTFIQEVCINKLIHVYVHIFILYIYIN